jgi:hypothetical protein
MGKSRERSHTGVRRKAATGKAPRQRPAIQHRHARRANA